MEKSNTSLRCVEIERQAQETVRLMFAACEGLIQENEGEVTPELKALAAAALSAREAVRTFLALRHLCE